jgi:glucose-6-phosphate 1-epimerase
MTDPLSAARTSTRFGRIVAGAGGLERVRIESPAAEGEMYLHGGHVTSWKPTGWDEVLFMSRLARFETSRAIRGGVPVCFPWFGAHPSNAQAPSHGFARLKPWKLDAIKEPGGVVTVTMSLTNDQDTELWWPSRFRLEHRATFGATLTLELIVTNTGDTPFTFEEALHTYYRVGDIRHVRVRGLERKRYLDALDFSHEKMQEDEIVFAEETDRIYLDTVKPVTIDEAGRRTLQITTERSHATVVWNPWVDKARALADLGDEEWQRFVCVETCNVAPRAVDLAPGHQHAMRAVISVAPASGPDRYGP